MTPYDLEPLVDTRWCLARFICGHLHRISEASLYQHREREADRLNLPTGRDHDCVGFDRVLGRPSVHLTAPKADGPLTTKPRHSRPKNASDFYITRCRDFRRFEPDAQPVTSASGMAGSGRLRNIRFGAGPIGIQNQPFVAINSAWETFRTTSSSYS